MELWVLTLRCYPPEVACLKSAATVGSVALLANAAETGGGSNKTRLLHLMRWFFWSSVVMTVNRGAGVLKLAVLQYAA